MSRPFSVLFLSIVLLSGVPAVAPQDAPEAFAVRPPVIAYTDSGINPYHVAFRAPDWTEHPSAYIPGYPAEARPLYLSLDAPTYEAAVQEDQDVWDNIELNVLYYVPGTRIVGMMTDDEDSPILDDHGHGTAVADAGSGNTAGGNPRSGILVLRVNSHTLKDWYAENEWVDVWSNSRACLTHVGSFGDVDLTGFGGEVTPSFASATYRFRAAGRLPFNGGGNGLYSPNNLCEYMPPWVVVVGAIRQTYNFGVGGPPYRACENCDRPTEVSASDEMEVALHDSLSETRPSAGTSLSTPYVAGYATRLITAAREHFQDNEGFHDGVYARTHGGPLPASGPLADGALDADEVEWLLEHSAEQVGLGQHVFAVGHVPIHPPEEIRYLVEGYGGLWEERYQIADDAMFGEVTLPPRPYDDYWHNTIENTMMRYWETMICRGFSDIPDWPSCTSHANRPLPDPLIPNP